MQHPHMAFISNNIEHALFKMKIANCHEKASNQMFQSRTATFWSSYDNITNCSENIK